jgi:hypothetical protein
MVQVSATSPASPSPRAAPKAPPGRHAGCSPCSAFGLCAVYAPRG